MFVCYLVVMVVVGMGTDFYTIRTSNSKTTWEKCEGLLVLFKYNKNEKSFWSTFFFPWKNNYLVSDSKKMFSFQSDRLEAEFGLYRQQSGGNYNISVQQVINSLRVQRIDLFNKLDAKGSNVHLANNCCKQNLTPAEIECLDNCFENTSSIIDNERASPFHIAGYIACKENTSSTLLKESDIFLEADS